MPCTHQLARARQQDTCHLCGFDLRGGSDQRLVGLPSCGHLWFQPGCSICKAIQLRADEESEKPYYVQKAGGQIRCKKCNGYWPDRCRCQKPNKEISDNG